MAECILHKSILLASYHSRISLEPLKFVPTVPGEATRFFDDVDQLNGVVMLESMQPTYSAAYLYCVSYVKLLRIVIPAIRSWHQFWDPF